MHKFKIQPLADRVLVQADEAEEKSKGGIIIPDPTKVTRIALENAASIAGLMLTTECLIFEKPLGKSELDAPAFDGGY